MEHIENILSKVADFVWGYPLIILLFGTHLFLTFRLGFIQKHLFKAIKYSLIRTKEGDGEISHFGSLMTALAATVGTGNIVGVATAVALGGPGAVMWMWLTGVFGIATKYAEALLSVKYRVVNADGTVAGGPMYVLEKALNMKWLGIIFAVFTVIASFGIGNMVQANSISAIMKTHIGISPWITGLIMTVLAGAVILGGIKSIARVCGVLVPFMAITYFLGCAIVLLYHYETVPSTLSLIFNSAFTGHAVLGGFVGAGAKEAIRYGIARGLFSNESGLGSAPIVSAAAQTNEPVKQALISSTATFWDTVVLCAMTGLVVVNSGLWAEGLTGAELTSEAFEQVHYFGPIILIMGLLTFVFSTILGWSYYGEKGVEYLFGKKSISIYRWVFVVAVFIGSVVSLKAVWNFADIANGLMAIPNLVALLLLNGVLVKETKKFFAK